MLEGSAEPHSLKLKATDQRAVIDELGSRMYFKVFVEPSLFCWISERWNPGCARVDLVVIEPTLCVPEAKVLWV